MILFWVVGTCPKHKHTPKPKHKTLQTQNKEIKIEYKVDDFYIVKIY